MIVVAQVEVGEELISNGLGHVDAVGEEDHLYLFACARCNYALDLQKSLDDWGNNIAEGGRIFLLEECCSIFPVFVVGRNISRGVD